MTGNSLAETELIGSVLIDPQVIYGTDVSTLKPSDFGDDRAKRVWEGILNLAGKGEVIDAVTLMEELRQSGQLEMIGPSFIIGSMDIAGVGSNADAYARQVREASKKRQLESFGVALANAAKNGKTSNELLRASQRRLLQIAGYDATKRDSEAVQQALSFSEPDALIKTGFRVIDETIGGIPRADMSVLAGRTSMGKSALAHQIADFVGQHTGHVVLMSPDQPKPEIIAVQASRACHIPLSLIRSGNARKDQIDSWRASVHDCLSGFLKRVHIYDGPTSLETALSMIRFAAANDSPLVILDHLQRLEQDGRTSRREFMVKATGLLKDAARQSGVALLVLSQLTRDIDYRDDPTPKLSDLSESKTIEEDANMVLLLHRPEYFEQGAHLEGVTHLIVAKHKTDERQRVLRLFFDKGLVTFKDVTYAQ